MSIRERPLEMLKIRKHMDKEWMFLQGDACVARKIRRWSGKDGWLHSGTERGGLDP